MQRVMPLMLLVLAWLSLTSLHAGGGDRGQLQPLWPGASKENTNPAPGAKGNDAADIPGVYLHPASNPNGTAIVVCPGGGYGGLAMNHEGTQIADWLNKHGITAVILQYRLGPKYHHPVELGDAQRALRYVRAHADRLKVDPKRVGILGFSAGGHLASSAGTHFDLGLKDARDPIDQMSCRPDFMVLLYPVITMTNPYTHGGSRTNLLGNNPDPGLVDLMSNEKQVTPQTPPAFLVHTTEDRAVPPENSVQFYLALSKNRVPAELHIYEKGQHGLGLGPKDLPFSSWPERCLAWMKGRGFLHEGK